MDQSNIKSASSFKTPSMEVNPDEITNEDIEERAEKCFNNAVFPLKLINLHPTKSKLIYQQLIGLWLTCWALGLFYWTAMYVYYYKINITVFCELLSSFGLYTLVLLKLIPLIYYNHIIQGLIKSKVRFWIATDPDLKREVFDLYNSAHYYGQLFASTVIMTLIMFAARPFYDPGKVLTIQWFTEKYYYHVLVYQNIFAYFLAAVVIGFNLLFVLFVTHLRVQFKILNWTIMNHPYDGTVNDMRAIMRCVDHHRFFLGYIKDIEKVFMIHLLALYILIIASCCMELYAIAEAPTTFIDKGRSFIYCTSLLVQLALFCFPVGELTSEILTVSDSFYMCNWEDASRAMQTWLPFAIHATQQAVEFKALGLITINKMAFVDVAKSTVSFLTLMRNMNSN